MGKKRKSSSSSTESKSSTENMPVVGLLSDAIQSQRRGTRFMCEYCDLLFYTARGLSVHQARFHTKNSTKKPRKVAEKKNSSPTSRSTLFTCIFCEQSRTGWHEMLKHKVECRKQQIIVKTEKLDGKMTPSYQCKLCKTFFKTFHLLRDHVKFEHKKDRLHCPKCKQTIFMKEIIEKHKLECGLSTEKIREMKKNELKNYQTMATDKPVNKKTTEVTLPNDEKGKNLNESDNLRDLSDIASDTTHNSSDDETEFHKCKFCLRTFPLQISLRKHIEKTHKDKTINASGTKMNVINVVEVPSAMKCELCPCEFPFQLMPYHLHTVHDIDKFGCRICSFIHPDLREMKNHISLSHKRFAKIGDYRAWSDHLPVEDDKTHKIKCRFCSVKDDLDNNLEWYHHMLLNHPQKLLTCPKCEKRINNVDILVEHVEGKHPDLALKLLGTLHSSTKTKNGNNNEAIKEKSHDCRICKVKFSSNSELLYHRMTEHNPKKAVISAQLLTKEQLDKLQEVSNESRKNPTTLTLKQDESPQNLNVSVIENEPEPLSNAIVKLNENMPWHTLKSPGQLEILNEKRTEISSSSEPNWQLFNAVVSLYKETSKTPMKSGKIKMKQKGNKEGVEQKKKLITEVVKSRGLGVYKYKCMYCERLLIHKGSLINHVRFTHKEEYLKFRTMNMNGLKIKKGEDAESHGTNSTNEQKLVNPSLKVRRLHEKTRFFCVKCPKSFSSYHGLMVHKGHAHVKKSSIKINKVRDENFHMDSDVAVVKKQHWRYKCLLCENGFQHAKDRKIHTETVHKKFYCINCREMFDDRKIYMLHKRSHTKLKAGRGYQCEECKRSFSMRTAYVMHKKSHKTKPKQKVIPMNPPSRFDMVYKDSNCFPFFCEDCCIGFNWMSDLALHSKSLYCGIVKPVIAKPKCIDGKKSDSIFDRMHQYLQHTS